MSNSALLPCAILIPSLNRAHRLRDLVANIHATTPEPHQLLFCVGDPDSSAILDDLDEWYLYDEEDPDKRYVTRMNKLAHIVVDQLPEMRTIFFGSDDVKHHPGWLTEALFWMEKGPSVIVVNDLRNRSGTQALIRVEYLQEAVFDSPGDAFHSGYGHNFADTEMFTVAVNKMKLGRAMDSFVEHLHPIWGARNAMEWDSTYEVGAPEKSAADQELFEARMIRFSEIVEGLK
jgi:hypothetical protein